MIPIGGSVEVSCGVRHGCEYGVRSFRRVFSRREPFRRADQMSTQSVRTDPDTKGRGPAIAGALAGLGVVIALVAVFVGVKVAGPDKPAAAKSTAEKPSAQSSAAEPPAAQPSAAE